MKLDRIDIRILNELQKNGRITNVELSELVHLSPSPCLMRVKKLQKAGYITGYSAQIDTSKLGQTLTVFTEVTLKNHRQSDFARFLQVVEKIEVLMQEEGPVVQPLWRSVFMAMDKKVKGFAAHPTQYIFPWDWSLEA